MAGRASLFTATSSSARQILLLLRCISFAKKVHVRVSSQGLRFSTEEGSILEAFVVLEKSLFSSYTYNAPPSSSSAESEPPLFEVNLHSLLETLNIFSLSDLNLSKRSGDYDSYAAHRLNRHAGISSLSNQPLGVTGICTLSYNGESDSALRIHMSEAGVTTTCALTTYEAEIAEEIPFDRHHLALKTIMRASYLLDAVNELNSLSPEVLTITAIPGTRGGSSYLSLSASGALGSANVEFTTTSTNNNNTSTQQTTADGTTTILETFQSSERTSASFKFHLIKHAQRAMSTASKVSLRLDEEGVLSMQFLVEVDAGDGPAFVDFRIVPLVDDEGHDEEDAHDTDDTE